MTSAATAACRSSCAALHAGSLVLSDPAEAVGDFLARAGGRGRHAHLRHPLALAQGAHERRHGAHRAALRAALGRDRRPGGARRPARARIPRRSWRTPLPPPRRASPSKCATARPAFPQSLVGARGARVELRVRGRDPADPLARARRSATSARVPSRCGGADGFVDTGDRVEERDGRYYFMGRRGGVINVGGLKVHPEEVEAVINAHPWVRMSLVQGAPQSHHRCGRDGGRGAQGRGAPGARPPATADARADRVLQAHAPAHKVPAMIRFVPLARGLPVRQAGAPQCVTSSSPARAAGLGLAISTALAAAGYQVIAVARTPSAALSAATRGGRAAGGAIHFRALRSARDRRDPRVRERACARNSGRPTASSTMQAWAPRACSR